MTKIAAAIIVAARPSRRLRKPTSRRILARVVVVEQPLAAGTPGGVVVTRYHRALPASASMARMRFARFTMPGSARSSRGMSATGPIPQIVEFTGLPGAGKTFLADSTCGRRWWPTESLRPTASVMSRRATAGPPHHGQASSRGGRRGHRTRGDDPHGGSRGSFRAATEPAPSPEPERPRRRTFDGRAAADPGSTCSTKDSCRSCTPSPTPADGNKQCTRSGRVLAAPDPTSSCGPCLPRTRIGASRGSGRRRFPARHDARRAPPRLVGHPGHRVRGGGGTLARCRRRVVPTRRFIVEVDDDDPASLERILSSLIEAVRSADEPSRRSTFGSHPNRERARSILPPVRRTSPTWGGRRSTRIGSPSIHRRVR